MKSLAIIGAPSSAGAYAPGQEQAPAALRSVGLIEQLQNQGVQVKDMGDVPGFRWQPDPDNRRAMNAEVVAKVARDTADKVAEALEDSKVLVLGGDCTVELGTIAGALRGGESIGLIYIDLDTDLNTPESTDEGAFDWMGVAHLLNIEGAAPELVNISPHSPMLRPEQIYLFAYDNVTSFEQGIIDANSIAGTTLKEVVKNPQKTAHAAINDWAKQFDQLFIHLDVDVLDFVTFPLAENTRHHYGLSFEQLMAALSTLLSAPNWVGLTITEVNPDHSDEATLKKFVEAVARALAEQLR